MAKVEKHSLLQLSNTKFFIYTFLGYAASYELISHDAEKVIIFCLFVVLTSIFVFSSNLVSSFLAERADRIEQEFTTLYNERVDLLKSLLDYHASIHNFHNVINNLYEYISSNIKKISNDRQKLLSHLLLLIIKDELKVLFTEQNDVLRQIHLTKLNKAFFLFNALLNSSNLSISHFNKENGNLVLNSDPVENAATWNNFYPLNVFASNFSGGKATKATTKQINALTKKFPNLKDSFVSSWLNNSDTNPNLIYFKKLISLNNKLNNFSLLLVSHNNIRKIRIALLILKHLKVDANTFFYHFIYKLK